MQGRFHFVQPKHPQGHTNTIQTVFFSAADDLQVKKI